MYDAETASEMQRRAEVGRLFITLRDGSEGEQEAAEHELEARCERGDIHAQDAALLFVCGCYLDGQFSYPDFAYRASQVLSLAINTRTISILLPPSWWADFLGAEVARTAEAEIVCILDQMADSDEGAADALAKISASITPEVLQHAKALRRLTVDAEPDMSMDTSPPDPAPAPPPVAWHYVDQPNPSRWDRCRWWLSDRAWDLRYWLDGVTLWSILTARPLRWRFQDWLAARRSVRSSEGASDG